MFFFKKRENNAGLPANSNVEQPEELPIPSYHIQPITAQDLPIEKIRNVALFGLGTGGVKVLDIALSRCQAEKNVEVDPTKWLGYVTTAEACPVKANWIFDLPLNSQLRTIEKDRIRAQYGSGATQNSPDNLLVVDLQQVDLTFLISLLAELHKYRVVGTNTILFLINDPPAGYATSRCTIHTLKAIERLGMNGPHVLEDGTVFRSPLFDHLFVFEASEDFEESMAAEYLFNLLMPKRDKLWDDLKIAATGRKNIIDRTYRYPVNSVLTAALYFPSTDLKKYVASRLVWDLFFGEQGGSHGILSPSSDITVLDPSQYLKRNFNDVTYWWVYDFDQIQKSTHFPNFGDSDARKMFALISQKVEEKLNSPQINFDRILEELDLLIKRFDQCQHKLEEVNVETGRYARNLLQVTKPQVEMLIERLSDWKNFFLGDGTSKHGRGVIEPDHIGKQADMQDPRKFKDLVQKRKDKTRELIIDNSNRFVLSVFRPATSVDSDGILDAYYFDNFRPDIQRYTESYIYLKKLRERFSWQIRNDNYGNPIVLLLIGEYSERPLTKVADEVCFRSRQDKSEILDELIRIANLVVGDIDSRSKAWFVQQITKRNKELSVVQDHYKMGLFGGSVETRKHYYLISPENSIKLNNQTILDIFNNNNEISQIYTDANYCAAMVFGENGPITAMEGYAQLEATPPFSAIILPQEQNAIDYEKSFRGHNFGIHADRKLHPITTQYLHNTDLRRLFVKGVLAGLIRENHDPLTMTTNWIFDLNGKTFDLTEKAVGAVNGLTKAFLQFSAILPNAQNKNNDGNNPFNSVFQGSLNEFRNKPLKPTEKVAIPSKKKEWMELLVNEMDEAKQDLLKIMICELNQQ